MSDIKTLNQQSISVKKFVIPLEKSFKIDKGYSYALSMIVDVIDKHLPDNFDGTEDCIWIAKPTGQFNIRDKSGEKILIKVDKRRNSQKLQAQIKLSNESNRDNDDEYDFWMTLIRHYLPEIKGLINKLEENE